MLDFLSHHPTAADILAAVYEVKPKAGNRGPQRPARVHVPEHVDDAHLIAGLNQATSFVGPSQPMPEDFKSSISWAEDIMKKMHIKN